MAALIERVSHMTFAGDCRRGFGPGMTGLAAAVQQQDRSPALAEHVSDELVAGGADEGCAGGSEVSRHGRREPQAVPVPRNPIRAALPACGARGARDASGAIRGVTTASLSSMMTSRRFNRSNRSQHPTSRDRS
jgi:hypothetical protein